MQQIKIFRGEDSEVLELQEEVNSWLKESGVKVVQITGNIAAPAVTSQAQTRGLGGMGGRFAPSDILIVVLYEEN